MPFGFGKKDDVAFTNDITDRDELEEIQRVAHRLDADEKGDHSRQAVQAKAGRVENEP